MNCPDCGAALAESARFCGACGQPAVVIGGQVDRVRLKVHIGGMGLGRLAGEGGQGYDDDENA